MRDERLRQKDEEEEEVVVVEEEALREVGWCWEGRPSRCAAAQLYVPPPFFFPLSPILFFRLEEQRCDAAELYTPSSPSSTR